MAAQYDEQQASSRGIGSRIGICLLNLICPGLGLVKLSRLRAAAVYVAIQMLALFGIWLAFVTITDMSFAVYSCLMGLSLLTLIVVYSGSMVQCWRASKFVVPQHPWWTRWYGLTGLALAAVIITWPIPDLLRSYYQTFHVPAESMMPTLEIGDRFLVKMGGGEPLRRGDVVIVQAANVKYVKRLVGIPGDHIEMRKGYIFLDGHRIAQQKIDRLSTTTSTGEALRFRIERLPGEARPHVIADAGPTFIDDYAAVTLGADQYFLLGDNRDNSADSRIGPDAFGLGLVSREKILGKSLFIFWRASGGWGEIPI